MCINQIAVFLELIGFIFASFFISVLKIDPIKRIADKVKMWIVSKAEQPRIVDTILQRVLISLIFWLLIWGLGEKVKQTLSKRRHKQLTIKQFVFSLSRVILIEYPLTILMAPLALLATLLVEKAVRSIAGKLSGHEAVTNLFIIFGTVLVFVGLMLEFIAFYV